MYAIVDIETTGSHPQDNGITEIAILLHNGEKVEDRFETLINPGRRIPPYVSQLTGITDQMTSTAPGFQEVAEKIYHLLQNRIFIAHNVNFDYSFVKYHLRTAGYEWMPKKLCTLKLSRKAFPDLHKYGLGHICRALDIPVENRHRAGGDAAATAILFDKILETGGEKLIRDFLKKENREQILPPNLPAEQIKTLPYTPGVYYFHDGKGKVIYVGKAKNLRQRVIGHFTGLNTGKKRQEFLRQIYSISHKECGTEFIASIFESVEIKRLWPIYNVSQKKPEQTFGLYAFEDRRGYKRLAIDKKRKYFEPVASFHLLADAYRTLWKLVRDHQLHPALCFLDKTPLTDDRYPLKDDYNTRVASALEDLHSHLGTYAIFEPALYSKNYVCVLVENGKFYGIGSIPDNVNVTEVDKLKKHITQYPENETIRSMVKNYAERYPSKVLMMQ